MTYVKSEFKFLDRGFEDSIVLIPGWATDCRIFNTLDLNYNYILPTKFSSFSFSQKLLNLLNRMSIDKISLFGWSLGGFLAVEFALGNLDRVDELILLSIRKRFDHKALEEVKSQLIKHKRAYLYKFYLECFSVNDKYGLVWFKKYLLKNYIREMKLEDLLCGLDYFRQASIEPKSLARVKKIRFFHGREDMIAPIKEVDEIKSRLPSAEFIYMPGVGHLPFLSQNFIKEFHNE